MPRLRDVTRYVRSKNAGPFWVTVDIFFEDDTTFNRHKGDPGLGAEKIGALFGVRADQVRRFQIDSLNVIKLSFPRLQPQGGVLERDMHSGQQYVPLLDLELLAGTSTSA